MTIGEKRPSSDDGREKSEQLRQEFLDGIPEARKENLLSTTERISSSVEEIWGSSGHKPKWTNEAHIDTNRNVNCPDDESLYARRDAHCKDCRFDMWLIVGEGETTIHGGQHKCEKKEDAK